MPAGGTAGAAPWPVASLQRRFGALMIDWLLCLLVAGFLGRFPNNWAVFVLVVEYAFFLGLFGQTPGMRLTGIACVSAADGRPIGIPRAFLRGVLLALLVPALIMDRYRRGWHDRAAGSVVVATKPAAAADREHWTAVH
ncbi:RDD family protein [Planosporangium sp. 12N6]|uniref:RDD family protein n=1 Tax=Planosporangium spinosum TaxID=3402278 RepID=UPI003CF1A2CF